MTRQSFLIRLGKAWSILQRDGLIRGIQRICSAIGMLSQPITPGDILFISGGVGDSARYRTKHVAEELCLHGFTASATVQDNKNLSKCLETFSLFVFHRVLFTEEIKHFFEILKAKEKTIIFETDDLVYDAEFVTKTSSYRQMNTLEKKLYEHGVGGEILADPAVTVATTTTNFLAEKLRERGKTVYVVPNRLSQQDVVWAKEARESKESNGGVIRIGYLSGTASHNKDFATITPALMRLLDRFPEVRLVLVGPLDIDESLQKHADRIERKTFVPRKELFSVIASLDINLAPLEVGDSFCESKSELKFFEAGIVGVPTVAAATQTFREAIHDGEDGYIAITKEEWEDKLVKLIRDGSFRRQMGEAAYRTSFSRYTNEQAENEGYYSFLRNHLKEKL